MNRAFHYNLIRRILQEHAKRRLADDASWASQMTDECSDRNYPAFYVPLSGTDKIPVVQTQSYRMSLWKKSKPHWRIWMLHFIARTPLDWSVAVGEPAGLLELIYKLLNLPDTSRVIRYLIGILLHTFADTGAHRTFVGFEDPRNRIRGLSVWPNPIGHAMDPDGPDACGAEWIRRKGGDKEWEIDNVPDFLQIVVSLHNVLGSYSDAPRFRSSLLISDRATDEEIADHTRNDGPEFVLPDMVDLRFYDFQKAAALAQAILYGYLATGRFCLETVTNGLR